MSQSRKSFRVSSSALSRRSRIRFSPSLADWGGGLAFHWEISFLCFQDCIFLYLRIFAKLRPSSHYKVVVEGVRSVTRCTDVFNGSLPERRLLRMAVGDVAVSNPNYFGRLSRLSFDYCCAKRSKKSQLGEDSVVSGRVPMSPSCSSNFCPGAVAKSRVSKKNVTFLFWRLFFLLLFHSALFIFIIGSYFPLCTASTAHLYFHNKILRNFRNENYYSMQEAPPKKCEEI